MPRMSILDASLHTRGSPWSDPGPMLRGVVAPRMPAFRGRIRERNALDDALDAVRAGIGGVLVVRGEPGIGKTALLHYAARQAAGCRVIQIAGIQSELEMPFAALHQL